MLNAFLGSADALLLAGISVLLAWIGQHLGGRRSGKLRDAVLIMSAAAMLLGGVEMAYAGGGWYATRPLAWLYQHAGWLGQFSRVAFTLIALAMLTLTGIVFINRGDHGAAHRKLTAAQARAIVFMFPVVCGLFTAGPFHSLDTMLHQPAVQVTSDIHQKFVI
jgi:hypothetical protein